MTRPIAILLASLAAHVGGTVAVVRHDGERHLIEARTDGSAMAPVDGPALALDGPMDLGPGALGALSSLVSGFAYAVPMGASVLLIGGDGDGEGTARYLDLLDILGFGGAPTEPERGALPADDTKEDEVHMAEEGGTRPTPRAEIIAEEQRAAREADFLPVVGPGVSLTIAGSGVGVVVSVPPASASDGRCR